jgi:hypothetical protein
MGTGRQYFVKHLLVLSLATLICAPCCTAQSAVRKTEVHFQRYPGPSLDVQLAAALRDHARDPQPLALIQDSVGEFASDVRLPANDDLLFDASASFRSGAHLMAAGGNRISCSGKAVLTSTVPNAYLVRAAGDGIDVGNCKANGAGGAASLVVALAADHVKHIRIHDITATDIGIADLGGTEGAEVWNFKATATHRGGTFYGVVTGADSTHLHVHDGRVDRFLHGVEWFNADANLNKGGPRTRAQVAAHGGWYTIENLVCESVGGACVWGSVAHDVLSRNNLSRDAGDVAFDCEGCIDYRSENDSSIEAANGGFATFFYSNHNSFVNPHHTSSTGKNGVMIYNDSRDPAVNSGTSVVHGVFNCNSVACVGVGGNASQNIDVSGSQFLNASIAPNDFWSGPVIENNHFVATVPMGAAINLSTLLGGAAARIENNVFESHITQAPGTPCVVLKNLDYNVAVAVSLTRNHCLSGFNADWDATSGSGNAGIGMSITLDGNTETHSGIALHGFGARDHVTKLPAAVR